MVSTPRASASSAPATWGASTPEGFLTLVDRRKDMIISGGFNIYPSDLEACCVLIRISPMPAVVGVPSEQWGETPVAFVVSRGGCRKADAPTLRAWYNARAGKTAAAV